MGKDRLCCCIPDQSNLEARCTNPAEYEIWYGNNPTPDDFTDACAKHLEELLDDHDVFTVYRIGGNPWKTRCGR